MSIDQLSVMALVGMPVVIVLVILYKALEADYDKQDNDQ